MLKYQCIVSINYFVGSTASGLLVAHYGFKTTYIGTGLMRILAAMGFLFLRDIPGVQYESLEI